MIDRRVFLKNTGLAAVGLAALVAVIARLAFWLVGVAALAGRQAAFTGHAGLAACA